MYDVIIKNGKVVDGSGQDAYLADIGIKNERIETIGNLKDAQAAKTIDAAGRIITPGFIDMHSHSDTVILAYPKMESMLHQGITTFVGCQCGHSIAPIGEFWEASQASYDLQCKVSNKLNVDMYDRDYYVPTKEILPVIEKDWGFSPTWETMGDFLDEVDRHGLSGNIITLSGYNTLRLNEAEREFATRLTDEQKKTIKAQIREAQEGGAFGMSTGLDYRPGVFTDTAELVEMAAELKPYDGIYFSHWRKTGQRVGTPKPQKKIDGIIEVLEIGLQNDIQVEISHISTGFDIFPANDNFMQVAGAQRTLQVVDEYVARGAKAYFDVIPNITGGTIIFSDLMAIFRPWYVVTGGVTGFVKNLAHPDYRLSILDHLSAGKHFRLNPQISPDWDVSMRVIQSRHPEYVEQPIREIARQKGKTSLETVLDLLMDEPWIKVFNNSYAMTTDTIKTFLSHPLASVGNDTFVFDLEGAMIYDPEFPNRKPNPNTYCGFIKYLTELGMPRLEDSVRKLSGMPAQILRLTDRGLVKEGYRADLVIIDLENLKTNENYIEPRVYPSGVEHVLVNGQLVIENGEHTGKLPGGSIRSYDR